MAIRPTFLLTRVLIFEVASLIDTPVLPASNSEALLATNCCIVSLPETLSPASWIILIIFSKDLNQQLLGLDPRECFEIELVTRNGIVEKYLVEVGDMLPAFALGAEF